MIRLAAALVLAAAPAMALAQAPETSPRPQPRSTDAVANQENKALGGGALTPRLRAGLPTSAPMAARLRPAPRPPAATNQRTAVRVIRGPLGPEVAKAPPRPGFIDRLVKEQATPSRVRYTAKGSICGVNSIKGVAISSFGRPGKGCGIANPVQVSSVEGVSLSSKATLDCQTAKALSSWVKGTLKPVVGKAGGGVQKIRVAAHYSCRNRNNARSGRLSEHAKGRAIDVSGFQLRDGTRVTVLKGWNSRAWSKRLRALHKGACGPFGTVLGPNADAYHRDHFHFDTARYRSGSYCR